MPSLQTLVVETETHLNNTPLTYVTTDHGEPEPLTPSHLLYGRLINTAPHSLTDEELTNENFQETGHKLHHTLSKAKTQALIIQHFWSRWKKEYLKSSRETHATNTGTHKERIRVGDVVIIHDDSSRLKWHLAVVQELKHGNDNLVRSATIRTVNGLTNRPISKLYPLEVNAGTDVSGGKSKDIAEEEDDDCINMPKAESKPLSSMRPQRSAAIKARTRVSEWNKILRGPEDVMTDCI